ncbi:MAG TPA: bifunctional 5,10-methylenetetrahydrofolate dehydrogenase/5,10-methenyltetrahydrofolate cyclohydrolase [Chloroflexota bacterium]|nr:bifunctional 5,10-methylenetetrahydrofolate dehydrogenase/5,10-methenyltetrahydrofolate cyclohydrolase [Chloroflexota bacterium]
MTARILDGRAMARTIASDVRADVATLRQSGWPQPALVVVRVGDDPASIRYAGQIERAFVGAAIGIRLEVLPATSGDDDLLRVLAALGADAAVNGILVQFPLPPHLSRERAIETIDPAKDVDGVNPLNAGRLAVGLGQTLVPATPLGGLELLLRSGIAIPGRHAVVVGRSAIVGRPLAQLLLRENATVTICHSRTTDLARYTCQADILAVAVGRPGTITGAMVAPGAAVLDFGMNVVDGELVGDVDADSVAAVAGALSPVPGGTGPMTNAMLLSNTLQAARWQMTHRR